MLDIYDIKDNNNNKFLAYADFSKNLKIKPLKNKFLEILLLYKLPHIYEKNCIGISLSVMNEC